MGNFTNQVLESQNRLFDNTIMLARRRREKILNVRLKPSLCLVKYPFYGGNAYIIPQNCRPAAGEKPTFFSVFHQKPVFFQTPGSRVGGGSITQFSQNFRVFTPMGPAAKKGVSKEGI